MTMSPASVASGRRRSRVTVVFALMCVAATLAAPLAAQDRGPGSTFEYSQPPPSSCAHAPVPGTIEPIPQPSPQARTQARELAAAARQSVVLGDLDRARSLLLRAVRLDPAAPNVPYHLARVLDDQGEAEQALAEYCRTIALGAPPDEAAFARERIRALADHEELRISDDASAPSSSTGPLRRQSVRGEASPAAALTLGMLIPGLGQYYSGRPGRGTVVASLAMGALASGFFVRKRSVDCLEPVGSGGGCLPDNVVRVTVSRPYVTTGIAVAASVALLGALDAYFGAREQRQIRRFTEAGGPHVDGPSISSNDGVAELSFFTIRMR